MSTALTIVNSIDINSPAATVWDALTNPEITQAYLFGCETVSEWEIGSEKKLLEEFYKLLKEIEKKEFNSGETFLKIVGFNHLAYDLNYLMARMTHHEIASKKELFNLLFTQPRHIDLAQLGMAVSKATKRDEDFRTISQKAINSYFEIPIKEASGKDVSVFYLKQDYVKIKKYCTEEFTFELLYQSLLQNFLH